jgi:hypothetical protein
MFASFSNHETQRQCQLEATAGTVAGCLTMWRATHATYATALLGEKAMTKPVVDSGVGECVLHRLRSRAKIGDA